MLYTGGKPDDITIILSKIIIDPYVSQKLNSNYEFHFLPSFNFNTASKWEDRILLKCCST
jgi:hypothetical protein